MKVAIVGGGYAGMATSFNFAKYVKSIDVFDCCTVGKGGASSISLGLFHPLSPKGRMLWRGLYGYNNTKHMLDVSGKTNKLNVYNKINVYRPLSSHKQLEYWTNIAHECPEWLEVVKEEQFSKHTGLRNIPKDMVAAVQIKNALLVNSPQYLESMWQYIQSNSLIASNWYVTNDVNVFDLASRYDIVIIACGASVDRVWNSLFMTSNSNTTNSMYSKEEREAFYNRIDAPKLDINLDRGQNLIFDCDEDETSQSIKENSNSSSNNSLEFEYTGLLNGEYCISTLQNGKKVTIVGATHESIPTTDYTIHNNDYNKPNMNTAIQLLQPKITSKLHTSIFNQMPSMCTAGVRVQTARTNLGRFPMIGRHPNQRNVYMISGFGSRGLIHHGTVSELLVDAIVNDDMMSIPKELQIKYK